MQLNLLMHLENQQLEGKASEKDIMVTGIEDDDILLLQIHCVLFNALSLIGGITGVLSEQGDESLLRVQQMQ